MNLTRIRKAIAMVAALAVVGVLGGPAAPAAEDVAAKVQSAKTAADHEALAAMYEKQAAEAKAQATAHQKMGQAYKGAATSSSGKSGGLSAMPQHCENLVKEYEGQAKMYETMAATERELAKAAK